MFDVSIKPGAGQGRSLLRALQPLAKWAEDNRPNLAEARATYLAEHPDRTNIR